MGSVRLVTPPGRNVRPGVWNYEYEVRQGYNEPTAATISVKFMSTNQALEFVNDVLLQHVLKPLEESTDDGS